MKILGVDPGTAIVGWGVVVERADKKFAVLDYGTITTSSRDVMPDRLFLIKKNICAIIKKYRPDCLAIEQLFYFKNQKTVITVAQAHGVIIAASRECDLTVFEYTPLQVKQALTGYGRAEKIQVQKMVKIILGLEEIPRPDDAADALAAAICHSQTNHKI